MNKVIITNSKLHHNEARKWCFDNIGIDSNGFMFGSWYCNHLGINDGQLIFVYFFKNENDAIMFKLRWA